MRKLRVFLFLVLALVPLSALKVVDGWLYVKPKPGDSIFTLLKRYSIEDSCSRALFKKYNNLKSTSNLYLDKEYKLPIKIESYNGKSIRSSVGISNYDVALSIQEYNRNLHKNKVRKTDFRVSKILWVPQTLINCSENEIKDRKRVKVNKSKEIKVPLFGKSNEKVSLESNALKGSVYYLVSGHGGPDPGAMTTVLGNNMCEDEYAYDVTLRLAKNLLEKGAKVYMIIRDKNDGIRDDVYLECDKEEVCYPNLKIPYNQVKRLRQRAGTINMLYKKHKRTSKRQRCIVIHVDSRSKREQIDVFFYHHKGSKTGEKLANSIRDKFEQKYKQYQKGRGYKGEVSSRNLYMLTKTLPVTCYIELGNIQHSKDRKRVELKENRQALANWLGEALGQE